MSTSPLSFQGRRLSRMIRSPRGRRTGAATVELALCLSVLLILTLGPVEICFRIHDRTTAEIAAYEGLRSGVRPGATAEHAREAALEILRARGIENGEVTVTPRSFSRVAPGDPIALQVFIPAEREGTLRSIFLPPGRVRADAAMLFEYSQTAESS